MPEIDIDIDEMQTVAIPYASALVSPPSGLAAVAVGSGGTFAAGTYFWEVTATTIAGETTVSNEASATLVLNGSANLSWTLPSGVITHIKVYRGTGSGTENTLVTTLGPTATAFTDTNVGAAGSPPAANTATVTDTVLLTGEGEFRGFSLQESTGTGAVALQIQDTSIDLVEVRISTAGSETEGPWSKGVKLYGRVNIHVTSGQAKGVVWVGVYC